MNGREIINEKSIATPSLSEIKPISKPTEVLIADTKAIRFNIAKKLYANDEPEITNSNNIIMKFIAVITKKNTNFASRYIIGVVEVFTLVMKFVFLS